MHLGWQKDEVDVFYTSGQALKNYIEQGRMNRGTDVKPAPDKRKCLNVLHACPGLVNGLSRNQHAVRNRGEVDQTVS